MPGPVETAIRKAVHEGDVLGSVPRKAPFRVAALRSDALVLALGEQATLTPIPWEALEGVPAFLRGRGWVGIGARHSKDVDAELFDGYLQQFVRRSVGSYVPAVLERADIVEVDRKRPAAVKLRD
ncbi:MAG: hypothetical protein AMXMBFR80_09410 [Dehalococcoidia bacterium]